VARPRHRVLATPDTIIDDKASLRDAQSGLIVGLICYLLWGFLPLLFKLLEPVGAVAIVANRTVWSLLFGGAILLLRSRMSEVRAALADRQTLRSMAISTVLLAVNWLIYVWAVETGQVLEGSFGYFINPLVNVGIGMLLLGERQNRMQSIAIVIAIIAIAIQAIGVGRIPYVALSLAVSFGFYGFFRKTAKVGSASGLFVETLLLVPLALAYLGYMVWRGDLAGFYTDPYFLLLLALTGPATAVPLLMFTYAVQRLRLTTIGMLQYIAPSIQFLLAIYIFHEEINAVRLLSFALIWLSLAIYSADSFMRRGRAAA
jgi:chloramphenicol-sensitive protein RarD